MGDLWENVDSLEKEWHWLAFEISAMLDPSPPQSVQAYCSSSKSWEFLMFGFRQRVARELQDVSSLGSTGDRVPASVGTVGLVHTHTHTWTWKVMLQFFKTFSKCQICQQKKQYVFSLAWSLLNTVHECFMDHMHHWSSIHNFLQNFVNRSRWVS